MGFSFLEEFEMGHLNSLIRLISLIYFIYVEESNVTMICPDEFC